MSEIISLPHVVCVCACHLGIWHVLSICYVLLWFPEDRLEVMTLRFMHVRHGGL